MSPAGGLDRPGSCVGGGLQGVALCLGFQPAQEPFFRGVAKRMCEDKCGEECREEDEFTSAWISRWVWMGAEHNSSSGTGFGQFKP